jgi:hypothetical protein
VIFDLDCAHVPGRFVLHASAVLIAKLYPPKGTQPNGTDETDEPYTGDCKTNWKKSECGSREYERRGGCQGGGCFGGLLSEDTVDKGCFLGSEYSLDFLAGRGALRSELDSRDEKRLQGSSVGGK